MQGVEQARREFIYRDFADPESRAGAARQQRMLTAVASGSLGAAMMDHYVATHLWQCLMLACQKNPQQLRAAIRS
jgi:hypothetical protein